MSLLHHPLDPTQRRRWARPLKSRQALQQNQDHALQSLRASHSEIVEVARLICAVGTALNLDAQRQADGIPSALTPHLTVYLPAAPLVFPAVIVHLATAEDCANSVACLLSFFVRMSFARNLVQNLQPAAQSAAVGPGLPIDLLVDVWRRLAGYGLMAIYELRHAMLGRNFTVVDHSATVIEQELRIVRDGGTPYQVHGDFILVPGWLDRRNAARSQLARPIYIWSAGRRLSAVLHNLSTTGAGLSQCGSLNTGCRIVLEPLPGRSIPGRVIWSRDNDAGLFFDEPLLSTDPLLNAEG
jgi:hypothetical protein